MNGTKIILKRILKEFGFLNNKELANYLEVSYDTLNGWIKRESIPLKIINRIVEGKNVSYDWLLTGKGEKFLNDENSISDSININNVDNKNGNLAVNGNIMINTKDYNVSNNEIEELLELLKDVPSSWIRNIIQKLKKSIEAIDNDFK